MKLTILKAFTMLWLMGMYVILIITFMSAYQSPDKTVRIAVNMSSEANLEFVMLTSALFASTLGSLFIFSDIRRSFNQRILKRAANSF
jgi:hypothetical protein